MIRAGAFVSMLVVSFQVAFSARAETPWVPMPREAYAFGRLYPEAQSLLFAFDYGHAIAYKRILAAKGKVADPEKFEKQILAEIFAVLRNPPTTKSDESDIAFHYAQTFPFILNLFDWSHLLHQWIYDVLATSEERGPGMKARVNELFAQYKANRGIAITDVCKTMMFMDNHYFSKAFRRTFPSLNLLIWSYHWLQIRLYQDLMAPTRAQRDRAVAATVKEFWVLISDLPDSAEEMTMMPETAKEAPAFAAMFPTIPAAFDNLHMLHDILSDLLVSEKVPAAKLLSEGIRMGEMAQDPEAFKGVNCPRESVR